MKALLTQAETSRRLHEAGLTWDEAREWARANATRKVGQRQKVYTVTLQKEIDRLSTPIAITIRPLSSRQLARI